MHDRYCCWWRKALAATYRTQFGAKAHYLSEVTLERARCIRTHSRISASHDALCTYVNGASVIKGITDDFSDVDSLSLLPPLLVHKSHPAETHYHRLEHKTSVALHTHASAPYIPLSRFSPSYSSELWIYAVSTGCEDVNEFTLIIDWWATIGRIATRYPTTLISWAVGVVALLMFHAWRESGKGSMPSVSQSLIAFICHLLPKLLAASFVVALLPLSPDYYLGTRGQPFLAFLAPVLLVVATGLVCVSWWLVLLLMWPLRFLTQLLPPK